MSPAPAPITAHIFTGSFGLQTTDPAQWLAVAAAVGLLSAQVTFFARLGRQSGPALIDRVGAGLERTTRQSAWAASGFVFGLWALTTAFVGFMWDVAWHTDLGRDRELFTVPHTLILLGLIGIGCAALVSIAYSTRARQSGAWRVGRFRIAPGAAVMLALAIAAGVAFPLDDLWHATYGIDVTMWSPTHLLMIGGASLTPLAIALLVWQAGQPRRHVQVLVLGTMLVGLSTLQLEFDMGVPQWQALFHPLLLAIAAGFTLTAGRALLGPWGALRTALVFIVMRGLIALLIGPLLGHTLPHFPLYLVEALCVEVAFAASTNPVRRALLGGVLVGTVGMAAEWGWTQVWGLQPWQPSLLPAMWVPLLAAIAAAVCGMGFAASLGVADARLRPALRRLPVAALVAMLVLLAVPLPRHGSGVLAHISTWPVSRAVSTVDRSGQHVTTRDVAVRVQLDSAQRASDADWFRVASWQGGGVVNAALVETSPGVFVGARPVPVGGNWKTIVYLGQHEVLAAAPISLPAEPDQQLAAVPLQPARTAKLADAQLLLLRENHGGAPWVADIAYALFLLTVAVWLGLLCVGARHVGAYSGGAGRNPRAGEASQGGAQRGHLSAWSAGLAVRRALRRDRRGAAGGAADLRQA